MFLKYNKGNLKRKEISVHINTKCSVAVHCLIFIYEYGEKTRVTSELLSRSTGVHAVTIRNILSALKKDGILFVKYGTGGATLRRPPHEITLYDICMALEPDFLSKLMGIHDEPSPLCPVGRNIHGVLEHSYEKVREDLSESLRGITLEDILSEYHQVHPEGSDTDTL